MIVGQIERVADNVALVHIEDAAEHAAVAIVRHDADAGIKYVQFYPDVIMDSDVDVRSLIERIHSVLSEGIDDTEASDISRAMQLVSSHLQGQDSVVYLHGDDGKIFAAAVSLELLDRIVDVADEQHGHIDPTDY